jgi:hypothetical protein
MPQPISMKLGIYIMAPQSISAAYLFLPSACVSVYVSLISLLGRVKYMPPSIARQWLAKHFPAASNILNNRRMIGRVIFYEVRVLSTDSVWIRVSAYRWWQRLGKLYPSFIARQRLDKHVPATANTLNNRRIVGLIFCAVHVLSNDSVWICVSTYRC